VKGGRKPSSPEDARYFVRWTERVIQLLEESDAFDTAEQKREVIELWRRGHAVYAGLAAQP
jgi:hypothetical protein